MWGKDYEMVVTTHLNTENIHNHIVVNSVSFKTGLKFENHISDHIKLREISDDVCREFNKSVLENAKFYKTVQRYIRLTYLHPKLLEYVDEGRIAFTPAVELSYLNDIEQQDLIQTIESEDCTPSLSQAVRMKKLSQAGELDNDKILEIMSEEKANQKERIKIPTERVRKFFPKNFTNTQIEDTIIRLCENYYKKQQRRNTPER